MLDKVFNAIMLTVLIACTGTAILCFSFTTDLTWLMLVPIGVYSIYLHTNK